MTNTLAYFRTRLKLHSENQGRHKCRTLVDGLFASPYQGNPYWRERLSTLDLLVKITCFVKRLIYIFSIKSSWSELVNTKEVNCINPSRSVRIPCLTFYLYFLWLCKQGWVRRHKSFWIAIEVPFWWKIGASVCCAKKYLSTVVQKSKHCSTET